MKKPTQPTREQLQEKIDDLLEVNAELIASRDAAYKSADRLEKKLSASLHWKEVAVIVIVTSLITFAVGLKIGHKITQRGKPAAWLSIPSVDSLTYSNMNSAFDNATKTNINLITRDAWDTGFSYAMSLVKSGMVYDSQRESWEFHPTKPAQAPKTYHPIVTRKGAAMLRK